MPNGVVVINTTPLIALSAAGCIDNLPVAIQRMRERGIWLSKTVTDAALAAVADR